MALSNETRLKNARKRHQPTRKPVVLYSNEGMLYKDDGLNEFITQDELSGYLSDDSITLIVVSYEHMELTPTGRVKHGK